MKKTNDDHKIEIVPFANEKDSLQLGDLTVENHEDKVSFFGSFDLTKDKVGLLHTQALYDFLGTILTSLKNEAQLPDAIEVKKTKTVENPFA